MTSIIVKITGDHPQAGKAGFIPTSKPFEELRGLLKVECDDGQGGFFGKENLEVQEITSTP